VDVPAIAFFLSAVVIFMQNAYLEEFLENCISFFSSVGFCDVI
jgi:hypothetical protein